MLQVPIYGKDKKTIVGYAQIFHDLEFYYALKRAFGFLVDFPRSGDDGPSYRSNCGCPDIYSSSDETVARNDGSYYRFASDLELRSKIESHVMKLVILAVNFNRMMDKIQENNQMQMRF